MTISRADSVIFVDKLFYSIILFLFPRQDWKKFERVFENDLFQEFRIKCTREKNKMFSKKLNCMNRVSFSLNGKSIGGLEDKIVKKRFDIPSNRT